jgi:hypothetical protein
MAVLNPHQRMKTTVMMPRALLKQADEMGRILGTGRNGFLSIATGLLLAQTEPLRSPPMRRKQRLSKLHKQVQRFINEAMEKA